MICKVYRIHKIAECMEKNILVAIIIGIVIIVSVIAYQVNDTTWKKSSTEEYYSSIGTGNVAHIVYPDNPQFLYGLKINKDKYLLGENIFVSISGIPLGFKDTIAFFTPQGKLYYTISIDGDISSYGKQYFRPQLLRGLDICDKDDLVGEWKIIFMKNKTEYLAFNIVDEMLPKNEDYYMGCNDTGQELVMDPSRMQP